MISEARAFLERLTRIELESHNLDTVPDLERFNAKVDELYSHCHEDLHGTLNILKKDELEDDSYFENYKDYQLDRPRFLFKISHYKNAKYGDLYVAYVTESALEYSDHLSYFQALFLAKLESEFKVVAVSFVNHENLDNIHWAKTAGIYEDDLSLDNAGEFVATER